MRSLLKQSGQFIRRRDPYCWLAPIYEGIETCYSGGAIAACKRDLVEKLASGEAVLFLGAGAGGDAVYAARRGVLVALCDTSAAMLQRAKLGFTAAGLVMPTMEVCSWEASPLTVTWPNIAANFFLNLFPAAQLPRVLARIFALLSPGGRLLIADFSPLSRSWFQKAYWYVPLSVANIFTGDAFHPMVDYREPLHQAGFRVTYQRDFRIFRWGPYWYRALVAVKPEYMPDADRLPQGTD